MQSAYVFSLDYFLINNQILRLRFLGGERRGGLRPHQLSPYRNQERIIYSNCFSWILTEICLLSIELHALENSFWVVIFTFALDICTCVCTLISFFQKVWALLIQETINVFLYVFWIWLSFVWKMHLELGETRKHCNFVSHTKVVVHPFRLQYLH